MGTVNKKTRPMYVRLRNETIDALQIEAERRGLPLSRFVDLLLAEALLHLSDDIRLMRVDDADSNG